MPASFSLPNYHGRTGARRWLSLVILAMSVPLRAARAAVHHLFEPPTLLRSSQQLEQLCNTRVQRADGGELLLYAARPSAGPARLPVLLLLHEFFGLNEKIVEKADALAEELGCLVLAPDTFRGVTTSFIPRAIWLTLSTPQQRVNSDLDDVVRWAASQEYADTRKLAVMGFCYGGGKAIRYTTQARPNAATVIFYGSPILDVEELRRLRAPVLAVYGVDDPQFPQRTIMKFREALADSGIEHEVMSYNGVGHAFWKNMEQVKREEMPVIAAYRLTTNFLGGYFRGDESFASKRDFLEFLLAQVAILAAAARARQEVESGEGETQA